MTFLHPELAWGFLSLPMILVLYLLRRRYMRRQVPSIYLWQKTLQEMDVTRPLQKLRRSVLLPLQLMLAVFLVLLLMQPVWPGGAGQTYIFVVDASASMQTKTESETRFAQSLRRIRETVSHAGADDSFVLIRAAETPQTVLSRTGDVAACLRALDGMQCGYGQSDLDAALSLADAIAEDGGTVIVYTDRDVPGDVHVSSFAGAENTALSLLRYESGHLFARVTNYGSEKTVTLVFSADGAVVDAREVTVPADGSAGITLAAPLADTYAAEIREADALEADNRISCTSQKPENYRVVITGSGARFLEAAMASRQDLTVIHGSEDSAFETSADLYILDAPLRMVRDAADTGIVIGAWKDAPQGKAYVQGGMPDSITMDGLAVRRLCPLSGGESLLKWEEDSILSVTDDAAVFGFSLLESNLAVKVDFPLLMRTLLSRLLPERSVDSFQGTCGKSMTLPLPENAVQVTCTDPQGHMQTLSGKTLLLETLGIYTVRFDRDDGVYAWYVSATVPENESDTLSVAESRDGVTGTSRQTGARDLMMPILWILLVLILLEWEVSRRVG